MKLGDKIRFFRTLKGYSQESVAESLKISNTAYAKIERGKTDVNYSRLEQIAKALDVKVEDIVGFEEKFVFNNHSTAQHFGYNYYNQAHSFENERKAYLDQISQLKKENEYLKNILDKWLAK